MDERSGKTKGFSRHMPVPVNDNPDSTFARVTRKALAPREDEVKSNIRSRSAKLRVSKRTAAPAWGQ